MCPALGAPRVHNRRLGTAPADAVYIGRGGKWGNPISHLAKSVASMRVGSREEAIASYERWLIWQPSLLASLPELRGRNLVCFCKPQACHGDLLFALANAPEDVLHTLVQAARHAEALPPEASCAYLVKVVHPLVFRALGRVIAAETPAGWSS